MLIINCSNHPSDKWSEKQRRELIVWGINYFGAEESPIRDLPFPNVSPRLSRADVDALADELVRHIEGLAEEAKTDDVVLHIMGETSLVVSVCDSVSHRQDEPTIAVVCSTTEREVVEHDDGRKESVFRFVRIRRMA